uniref:E3 ubiquitin-protein ligase RNF182 n=1 Tax=Neogobius melanostomus TaxID=47308 RepID=A0A8C6UY91_9GOBI
IGQDMVSIEELECKICYSQYNLQSRRPKLLDCCHSLCSKCLRKILDVGDAFPRKAVCPFCRYPTTLRVATELLLSPRALTSLVGHSSPLAPSLSSSSSSTTFSSLSSSPSFVLITIMEPRQGPRPTSSLDSLVSMSRTWGTQLWQSWARVLVWVLGLLYFSSLPIGVYLLLLHRPTMGVLMVSLVPASLALVMCYGLCQCLWH